jgi:hypothetical protein
MKKHLIALSATVSLALIGSAAFAGDNTANVIQNNSTQSQAYVDQLGWDGKVDLTQTGSSHVADIDQNGLDQVVNASQAGNNHYLQVVQGKNLFKGGNEVVSTQSGSYNTAKIFQNDYTTKNTVTNVQAGAGNTMEATQNGALTSYNTINNRQVGDNGKAYFYQEGLDNSASVNQFEGNYQYAEISQKGSWNDASLTQGGYGWNTGRIMQTGVSNAATVSQVGYANTAHVNQK